MAKQATHVDWEEKIKGKSFVLSSKAAHRLGLPIDNKNFKSALIINQLRFPEMMTEGKFKEDILNVIPEGEAFAVIGEGDGKWQVL